MDGEHQRTVRGHGPERAEQPGEHAGIVDVGRAVQRDESVSTGCESEPGQGVPGPRPLDVREQGVGHDVADEMDLVRPVALTAQVHHGFRGGREQQVRDPVGDDPVHLLGHGPVPAAQPRFDMGECDAGLGRDQCTGQRGVDVADHHDNVRADPLEQGLEGGHDPGGLSGMATRTDVEEVVRGGQAEIVEEHAAHRTVVVLPGMDERGPRAAGRDRGENGGDLHEIGPRTGDEEHMHDGLPGMVLDLIGEPVVHLAGVAGRGFCRRARRVHTDRIQMATLSCATLADRHTRHLPSVIGRPAPRTRARPLCRCSPCRCSVSAFPCPPSRAEETTVPSLPVVVRVQSR